MNEIINETKDHLEYNVRVFYFKDGDHSVIFCPSLEIILSSLDESKLDKLFDQAIINFSGQCIEFGTELMLSKLGWIKVEDNEKLIPPEKAWPKDFDGKVVTLNHKEIKIAA